MQAIKDKVESLQKLSSPSPVRRDKGRGVLVNNFAAAPVDLKVKVEEETTPVVPVKDDHQVSVAAAVVEPKKNAKADFKSFLKEKKMQKVYIYILSFPSFFLLS